MKLLLWIWLLSTMPKWAPNKIMSWSLKLCLVLSPQSWPHTCLGRFDILFVVVIVQTTWDLEETKVVYIMSFNSLKKQQANYWWAQALPTSSIDKIETRFISNLHREWLMFDPSKSITDSCWWEEKIVLQIISKISMKKKFFIFSFINLRY